MGGSQSSGRRASGQGTSFQSHFFEIPPGSRKYEVIEMKGNKPAKQRTQLVLSFPQIHHVGGAGELLQSWDIKYLRGYGQSSDVFSFETGRLATECPETIFNFKVTPGIDLYLELNQVVAEYNDGVASDRYAHLKLPGGPDEAGYAYPGGPTPGADGSTYDIAVHEPAKVRDDRNAYERANMQQQQQSAYDHTYGHSAAARQPVSTEYDVLSSDRRGSDSRTAASAVYGRFT